MSLPASSGSAGVPARLARAKINYALHVTGRRDDGYHLIDTLAAFPAIGDRLALRPAPAPGLAVSGRFAAALEAAGPTDDNLVWKAARRLAAHLGRETPDVALDLKKTLPVASGIGGGSADAAAALMLLRDLWQPDLADDDLAALALELGADVPMCLASRPVRASGIGEVLSPLSPFPAHAVLLVNPGVAVSTPAVFKALERRDNAPLPAIDDAGFASREALWSWLGGTRNDLQAAARALAPEIGTVLSALEGLDAVRVARMSGSGATCFALFDDLAAAQAGETRLRSAHADWWIAAAPVAAVAPPSR